MSDQPEIRPATLDEVRRERRRQRWLRRVVVVALGMAAVTVGAGYWARRRHRSKPRAITESVPAGVNQQVSGYTFTRSEGGRQIFTVHAARTLAYGQGGPTVLEDVSLEVFGRAGDRHDEVRAGRCRYHPDSGRLDCAGSIELLLNAPREVAPASGSPGATRAATLSAAAREGEPVRLEASNVTFEPRESVVETGGRVEWQFGPASGSARGLAYHTRDQSLELNENVAFDLEPDSQAGGAPLHATAGGLYFTRATGEIDLRAPVELSQGTRRVSAEAGTLWLDARHHLERARLEGGVDASDSATGSTLEAASAEGDFAPGGQELEKLTLRGPVQAELVGAGSSEARRLTAGEAEVDFVGRHFNPTAGVARGGVEMSLQTSARPPGAASPTSARGWRQETLSAPELDFQFRPKAAGIEQAQTVGAGQLVLVPADPGQGRRLVTAGQLRMEFDVHSRLQSVEGGAPTRVALEPAPNAASGATPMESTGDRLVAQLDPASGGLRALTQSGHFHFVDGDRQGTADEAAYRAARDTVTLTGAPLLWQPDGRLRADQVVVNRGTETAEGLGRVRSTHFGPVDPSSPGAPSEARATHVVADRVLVDRRAEVAHYEGHVRAWHGYDVIESPSLDIYWKDRRVVAGAGVMTSDLEPPAPPSQKGKAPAAPGTTDAVRPASIRADRLEYFDLGREARYEGHVQLQADGATLTADRLNVYFSNAGAAGQPAIERAVAAGHVVVTQPDRRATGEHAEYFADSGQIVLTGGPPTLSDAEKGFITGQILTFFTHDDSLVVEGGVKSPTISKHRILH